MGIFDKSLKLEALTETAERKTYTVALATVAVVIIMIFFAIRPAVVSIFDRLSENKEKRRVITQLDTKYESLLSLNKMESDRADTLGLLDVSMPLGRMEEFVVANVMLMLQENNLRFQSISISESDKTPGVKTRLEYPKHKSITTNLTVTGQRSNIVQLVKDLEDFPRIIHITRVTVVPNLEDGDVSGTDIRAQIDFEFYYYIQQ